MTKRRPDPTNDPQDLAASRTRRPSRRFWLVLAAAVLATGLPCYLVHDWLHVESIPVVLRLVAPRETEIHLLFGPEPDDFLPLVPLSGRTRKGLEERWGAELPPRQHYEIALGFPRGVSGARFHSITLASLRSENPLTRIGEESERGRGTEITCRPGESAGELSWGPPRPWGDEAFAWLWLGCGLFIGFLGLASWLATTRARPRELPPTGAPRSRWILVAGSVVMALHLAWVLNAPSFLYPDTIDYAERGLALLKRGRPDLDGIRAIDRLPGYPAFLAAIFGPFGPDLVAVAVAQVLIFGSALTAFALVLRRYLPAWAIIAGIAGCGISHVQLHYLRAALSESVFVSLSLLTLATLVASWSRTGPARLALLSLAGMLGSLSIFTRPTALAHLLPLVLLAAGDVERDNKRLRSSWRTIGRSAAPYVVAALVMLAPLLAWCLRNRVVHHYLAPASMTRLSMMQGELATGVFDARALADSGSRESFTRDRDRVRYGPDAWSLRPHLEQDARQQGVAEGHLLSAVEEAFGGIVSRSREMSPPPISVLRILRPLIYNLRLFAGNGYLGLPPVAPFPPSSQAGIAELDHATGERFVIRDAGIGIPRGSFTRLGILHDRYFRWLVIAAFASTLVILWRGLPPLAAAFAFYLGNVILIGLTAQHEHRYTDVLDVFLIWTVMAALGLLFRRRSPGVSPATG